LRPAQKVKINAETRVSRPLSKVNVVAHATDQFVDIVGENFDAIREQS